MLFIGSLHLWYCVAPLASTGGKSLYWYLMVPTMSTLYLHVFMYIPIPLPNHKRKPTYNLPRALSGFSFSSIENSVTYTKSPKIESSINLKRFLLLVGVLENVHLYYWERARVLFWWKIKWTQIENLITQSKIKFSLRFTPTCMQRNIGNLPT